LGRKLAYHQERLVAVDDEKKRERKGGYIRKLLDGEPFIPVSWIRCCVE